LNETSLILDDNGMYGGAVPDPSQPIAQKLATRKYMRRQMRHHHINKMS
jgi:hypothetical protein